LCSANKQWQTNLCSNGSVALVPIKTDAPYSDQNLSLSLLNPAARADFDDLTGKYLIDPAQAHLNESQSNNSLADFDLYSLFPDASSFSSSPTTVTPSSSATNLPQLVSTPLERALLSLTRSASKTNIARNSSFSKLGRVSSSTSLAARGGVATEEPVGKQEYGVGVDMELIATFEGKDEDFLSRNFTTRELEYCRNSPNPLSSIAGKWCAKEAVLKAITSAANPGWSSEESLDSGLKRGGGISGRLWRGSGASLKDIEVLNNTSGAPLVRLTAHPDKIASQLGISDIRVSISHTDMHCIAQALVLRY